MKFNINYGVCVDYKNGDDLDSKILYRMRQVYKSGKKAENHEVVISSNVNYFDAERKKLQMKTIDGLTADIERSQHEIEKHRINFEQDWSRCKISYEVDSVSEAKSILSLRVTDYLIWSLMLAEAVLCTYLVKMNFFIDTDFYSYFISIVCGFVGIPLIAYILGVIPSFLSPVMRYIYLFLTMIFAFAFIVSLIMMRSSVDMLGEFDFGGLFFQIGMLGMLLFGIPTLETFTRDPIKKKDAKALVKLHSPIEKEQEHYNQLLRSKNLADSKLKRLNDFFDNNAKNLKIMIISKYIDGTNSFPKTQRKHRANLNAQETLKQLSK